MIDVILAVILDFLLGDPYSFPHPVKLMGRIISLEEKLARRLAKNRLQLKIAGFFITIINIGLGFFLPFFLLKLVKKYRLAYSLLNIYLIYTCIAARSLHYEAMKVKRALSIGLDEGRQRLSYIVGRDTSYLDEQGIIKATVETVSENTSDGVIAPLLFIFLGGDPAGLMYKFINTMDSMLCYNNEKYQDLGYFPAKIDDLANYLPARITAILMCMAALGKYKVKNGFHMVVRDGRNHKSPNAGYPEAAIAGLLGVQLGGDNIYHGLLVRKPTIGDDKCKETREHIRDSVELMYRTEILLLLVYIFINIG